MFVLRPGSAPRDMSCPRTRWFFLLIYNKTIEKCDPEVTAFLANIDRQYICTKNAHTHTHAHSCVFVCHSACMCVLYVSLSAGGRGRVHSPDTWKSKPICDTCLLQHNISIHKRILAYRCICLHAHKCLPLSGMFAFPGQAMRVSFWNNGVWKHELYMVWEGSRFLLCRLEDMLRYPSIYVYRSILFFLLHDKTRQERNKMRSMYRPRLYSSSSDILSKGLWIYKLVGLTGWCMYPAGVHVNWGPLVNWVPMWGRAL